MRLPSVPRSASRRRVVLAAVLVVVVVVAGLLVVRELRGGSDLQQALATAPAGTKRVAFTDWAAVRERVARSRAPIAASRVDTLLERGYDRDLTSSSSIADSGSALATNLGFGPGNADWEAYGIAPEGAAMVLRMDDSVDFDGLEDKLRSAGYDAPGDDGVWDGGADLVSSIDPTITPELQYVALDAGRHLVVSSDTASYAAKALRSATGDADSLASSDAGSTARALAGRVEGLASAVVWPGDYACSDLSMSQAAPEDERSAEDRVSDVGGVAPLDSLVIGERADGDVRVAMAFESGDQAEENLRPRAELVVGEDPSRPQPVGETYRLTRSRTDGDAVLLDLRPRPDVGAGLSGITSGPVLFATC
ncbi:hypothetical protein GCM10011519_17180 [Marmoricola endophyticus]|uniref:Uncharacterized protein n=1 Tax=Marmoricola endophyticus TaxID=2040280 RepID=A0A917F505_9ACTN|nr:hypothetical protein [Marmoricola endophyticus]GGF43914.1 hypothetical protein GCM10011519_17180 [Marmoricola endophyticus]